MHELNNMHAFLDDLSLHAFVERYCLTKLHCDR